MSKDQGNRLRHRWLRWLLIVSVVAGATTPIAVMASHRFTDVPDANIFHDDIAWLADAGVTLGCNPPDNDEFCPSDFVTREQMAAFMRRLAETGVVDADTVDGLHASEFDAGDRTLWINPLSAWPSPTSDLQLDRGSSGTTLRVTSTATGSQWVRFPLHLTDALTIKQITVCYGLSSAATFISQVRFTEETIPPTSPVMYDNGTDLTETTGECVDQTLNLTPNGAITLQLRFNFASTLDRVDIGAIGLLLGP